MRILPAFALIFVVSCTSLPTATPEAPPAPAVSLEESNHALVERHNGIWDLMELSDVAKEELNAIVISLNSQIHKNRQERPEAFAEAMEVKRSHKPLTHEEYMASHTRRFNLLKISASTQKELLDAADFVWKSLHDPLVPDEKRQVAQIIRDLMTSMNGPPPCCDENIFQRAAR